MSFLSGKSRGGMILAALLVFAFPGSIWADSLATIQSKVAQCLRRPGIRSANWGIEIVDSSSNQALISVNPDKPFKPASVLKVVTTAAALEKLGPDYRFHTGLYTDGTLQPDGTVVGNLILLGHGDPNLMDTSGEGLEITAFLELAEKLQALGIKKVVGDVIGDDSYFDFSSHGKGWTAADFKSFYGAPISAFCVNNNILWVHARPTKRGQLVVASVEPWNSYFRIRNLATTGRTKAKKTIYARLIPGTRTVVVSGILPINQGFTHYVVMDKPTEVAASFLRDELHRLNIHVSGTVQALHDGDLPGEARRQWKLLADHESPPLIRALEIINKQSQNLHAEMLLRILGAEFRGSGSDEAGLQVVREFLIEAGIESHQISLSDGCGLSRDNVITPHFQTSLLLFLSTRPYFDLFLNTLAVSGTDGTLKRRLVAEPVRGVIHAKTGSLHGVSTLAGYITTKSGRNLAFSIFANNAYAIARVKKTIDEICTLFVNLY
jgi:D-alanyl-D-alanine carboxypeptidase/D-alanyl-D-alanine-endopeptidase (penicillin-binding protein 4)